MYVLIKILTITLQNHFYLKQMTVSINGKAPVLNCDIVMNEFEF